MKILKVPLLFQASGSADCLPVCVQMVMAYYGIEQPLTVLKKKLIYIPGVGTSLYANGLLLLEYKFKPTAITAQPLIFPPDIRMKLKTTEDILRLVEEKLKHLASRKKDQIILKSFQEYLQQGGFLKMEIPNFQHIRDAIDAGHPLIALMFARAMGSREGGYHGVVVIGYRHQHVLINNPSRFSHQQYWVPYEDFMYGVHASTCVDFDNGTLLEISL